MAPRLTQPGVYVEEVPAGVRTIEAAPTSICAFIGRTPRGPVVEQDGAVPVHSFAGFERIFGGLDPRCPMGFAVRDFFANGGAHALVLRLHRARAGSRSRDGIGLRLRDADYIDTGLAALRRVEMFNLLCIPPDRMDGDTSTAVWRAALETCSAQRAMLLVDAPAAWADARQAADGVRDMAGQGFADAASRNAALYFPRIAQADAGQAPTRVPSGAVAGVIAGVDRSRGVWKAPAGVEASLEGAAGLSVSVDDRDNDLLNPLGVNALRRFPGRGILVWGARTMRGADAMGDEYKYLPVRRLALHIEQSVSRGIGWAAFEANGEALWARLRAAVSGFMDELFRQGAFAATVADQAWFVRCDAATQTGADREAGPCRLLIGFAPLKPAEFLLLEITQATAPG